MYNGQLELSLEHAAARASARGRSPRLARAHWWFQRMRQVVDRAIDWQPAPPPRPEQMLLAQASQETAAKAEPVSRPHSEERQICE